MNNQSRYKAVILDIDDTLLTARKPKWQQHKWVAKHCYDLDLTEADLLAHWGKPFDDLAAALYRNRGTKEERRANFIRHELEFPKQYEPHALESITALHEAGVTLGLMTAMYKEGAMIDLRNVSLPFEWFAFIQGSEATNFHKPDGRVFAAALKILQAKGIQKNEIVYVGEALSDLQAAQNADLDFIAVTQGMVDAATFRANGAQTICKNLAQVKNQILAH